MFRWHSDGSQASRDTLPLFVNALASSSRPVFFADTTAAFEPWLLVRPPSSFFTPNLYAVLWHCLQSVRHRQMFLAPQPPQLYGPVSEASNLVSDLLPAGQLVQQQVGVGGGSACEQ